MGPSLMKFSGMVIWKVSWLNIGGLSLISCSLSEKNMRGVRDVATVSIDYGILIGCR